MVSTRSSFIEMYLLQVKKKWIFKTDAKKYRSGNNRFITNLADVWNFWWESIRYRLPNGSLVLGPFVGYFTRSRYVHFFILVKKRYSHFCVSCKFCLFHYCRAIVGLLLTWIYGWTWGLSMFTYDLISRKIISCLRHIGLWWKLDF